MKPFFISRSPTKGMSVITLGNIRRADKFIIFTLFFYFLSYPFVLRNFMGVVYPLILNGLLAVTFLVCATGRVPMQKLKLQRGNRILMIGMLLYSLYFAVLILVSIFHSSELKIGMSAFYEVRELVFALIILFILSDKGVLYSLRLYVAVFTLCSILGLLLVFLNFMAIMQPITEVDINNFAGGGENKRMFFGIGFIWPGSWIGSMYGLERLQSFADEAGTFAFAVLPAILLSAYWRMKARMYIMIVALIFTFSVGAISIWLFIMFFFLFVSRKHEGDKAKRVFILLFFMVGLPLTINNLPSDFIEKTDIYFSAKYADGGGEDTSVGQRLAGLEMVFDSVHENLFGVGVNGAGLSLNITQGLLAVGWIVPLVEAGLFGWFIYVLAFGLILVHGLRNAIASSGIKQITAIVILINGYAAFQRAAIDANIWQLFWLIVYLRVVVMEAKIIPNSYSKNKHVNPVDFLRGKVTGKRNAL